MRFLTRFCTKTFLTIYILLLGASPGWALEDAIVAVVNNEIITLQDLKNYIHNTFVSLSTQGMSEEELKQIMLDLEINGVTKLIEDKLMLTEANKVGILVRDKLVEERINDIKSKYPNEGVFLEALNENGATLTELKNKITDELKIRYLVESQVKNKIYINPQEISKFYEKNKDKFSIKDRIKLDSIYLPFEDNKDEAKKKAEQALKEINEGKDFNEVAHTYSAPSSFGAVERGQLKPDIENKLFALELGQHSNIIEVGEGYYIFFITAKTPAKQAPLEDVKDTVYAMVFKEKFKKKFAEWLQKIKKSAYIEIRD